MGESGGHEGCTECRQVIEAAVGGEISNGKIIFLVIKKESSLDGKNELTSLFRAADSDFNTKL